MAIADNMVRISPSTMQAVFESILSHVGFEQEKAVQCTAIFVSNSIDGIYTHGVNRFPRFVQYVKDGFVNPHAVPVRESGFGALEQWNGNLGPGPLNAKQATIAVMDLARQHGIGCVALRNTNHWMRGGTYGWQAAREGYIFIGWTNTLANMPAWGAVDARLGNNPLVLALPYKTNAIVLDMAMSQYSFGAIELASLKQEKLAVAGGYDSLGNLTHDPDAILQSNRPLPIGFWKGAGLSLLLDLLAVVLSGGQATHEISGKAGEYGLSQVFIAMDTTRLANHPLMANAVQQVLDDYLQSVPENDGRKISYPGERVMQTREKNMALGIPVVKKIWDTILQLNDHQV